MNENQYLIRPIKISDCKALENLSAEFEEYLNTLEEGRNKKNQMTEGLFKKHAFGENPDFFGLILEYKNLPQGFVIYNFGFVTDPATRVLNVIDIFISEEIRSKGFGREMMYKVKDIAQESNSKIIILTSVWKKNKKAQEFYNKLGASLVYDEVGVWWEV